jgi:hypothetical protein
VDAPFMNLYEEILLCVLIVRVNLFKRQCNLDVMHQRRSHDGHDQGTHIQQLRIAWHVESQLMHHKKVPLWYVYRVRRSIIKCVSKQLPGLEDSQQPLKTTPQK